MGDSLSRQFAKTLDCMFQYKLNMSHRVVYRSWFLGGRVVYGTFHAPRPLDVLVLNFGHHLDHGAGDQTHTKLMSQWALTFKDLARNKVAADRVFVRICYRTANPLRISAADSSPVLIVRSRAPGRSMPIAAPSANILKHSPKTLQNFKNAMLGKL